MAAAALLAAAVAVLSQIMVPLPPPMAPVNLALLGVYLAAALLGPRGAALSLAAYLALGIAGLPVFAGLQGGVGALLGRTGGFLLGYPLCALLAGWLYSRGAGRFGRRLLAFLAGSLPVYLLGVLWFARVTGLGLSESLAYCVLPFLPGDLAKAVFAALLGPRLQRALPGRVSPGTRARKGPESGAGAAVKRGVDGR